MHPLNNKRHSTINHIGNMQYDRASRCPCKNGPVCRHCNYCSGCSCRCHTFFTLNFRFFKREDELKLLHRVKLQVGREELEAAEEAEKRLSMAVRGRFGDVGAGGTYGLHCMDVIVDPESVHALVEEMDETMSQDESEPGHVPPSPIRKSRRKLGDDPEPVETSPDSDDAASGEMGEACLDENGMLINVQNMKVMIRCQPGAFAKGHLLARLRVVALTVLIIDPRRRQNPMSSMKAMAWLQLMKMLGTKSPIPPSHPKSRLKNLVTRIQRPRTPRPRTRKMTFSMTKMGKTRRQQRKHESILGDGQTKNVSASASL
jgi:hypothetical protein